MTTDNRNPGISGLKLRSVLLVVAGVSLLYGAGGFVLGGEGVLGALGAVPFSIYALVLGCSLLNYLIRYLRWAWFLRRRGSEVPAGAHGMIYLAGFAYTATPGKVGEALRGVYLKDYGVPLSRTVAAVGVERLADVVTMALLALAVIAASPYALGGLVGTLVLLGGIAWALHSGVLVALSERFLGSGATGAGLTDIKFYLRPRIFLAAVGAGLLGWGVEGIGFHITLQALDVDISVPTAIGIYAAASLLGALSFMPGGIGGAEAVMTGLLMARGVDAPTAFAATLISRGATLWFAVLIGFCATLLIHAGKRPGLSGPAEMAGE